MVSLPLHRCPKPVVAALPGAAAGAGMSIALAADIRLAAERAIVVPAFANVGCLRRLRRQLVPHATRRHGKGEGAVLHVATSVVGRGARPRHRQPGACPTTDSMSAALDWCRSLAERAPDRDAVHEGEPEPGDHAAISRPHSSTRPPTWCSSMSHRRPPRGGRSVRREAHPDLLRAGDAVPSPRHEHVSRRQ